MCGIIGTTKNTSSQEFLHHTHTLAHRGPDYTGMYEDEHIHIAHLLLAIRGAVSESTQPVVATGSPWVLAFNGQLYNTFTIRNTLGADAPTSDVDTTLLYALITKYGWGFIEHIQGMFAIALYNKDEKKVRLYRDQSGQKNLYYTETKDGLMFASEIKTILDDTTVPRTIDENSLIVAATLGYIPGNRTLIENIYKLHPSEELTYDITTHTRSSRTFVVTGEDIYTHLKPTQVLPQVVADHLQSKREISINLSGGLDSSLIFHEAVTAGYSMHAFSTQFEDADEQLNRDADLAEKLAHEYGQKFTPIHITKQSYLDHLARAYTTIEEPNYNISVPIYAQTAHTEGVHGQGLRVVLSGDGGDELFGGYPHYRTAERFRRLKRYVTPWGLNIYKKIRNGGDFDYREMSDVFFLLRTLGRTHLTSNQRNDSVRSYLKESVLPLTHGYAKKKGDVYTLMLYDRFLWLVAENFIRSDKLFMRESMEMRCPLSYTPLRSYFDVHIPEHAYVSPKQNKVYLRQLYAEILPDYIAKRKDKTGWRAPVAEWYDQSYKMHFIDILESVKDTIPLVNWEEVIRFVKERDTWPGKQVHFYLSLALLIREYKLT